jgi:hypothetical protein
MLYNNETIYITLESGLRTSAAISTKATVTYIMIQNFIIKGGPI